MPTFLILIPVVVTHVCVNIYQDVRLNDCIIASLKKKSALKEMGSSSLAAVPEVGMSGHSGGQVWWVIQSCIYSLYRVLQARMNQNHVPWSELTLWQGRQIITKYVTSGDRHSEE